MKYVACIIAFMLSPLSVPADDANKIDAIEKKVDVIEKKIDTVVERQDRIPDKVENDPLQGRKYGVELNPLGLLRALEGAQIFSGTVSYFSHALNAELALPFFYWSDTEDQNHSNIGRFSVMTIDAHYRHFLGDAVNGFYISGSGRLARLHGRVGDVLYSPSDGSVIFPPYETENKFGIGIGIGYRIFSKEGLYWGINMSAIRYIYGENEKFNSFEIVNDLQTIFEIELLKFGYAF